MREERTSVLIVGAGLGGLSTAMFLGVHGTACVVAERHPGTATQPKARGQAPEVMEALGVAAVAGEMAAATPPGAGQMRITIAETVTGRVIHRLMQSLDLDFSALSPASMGMASQERAEAIMAARAAAGGADLRFGTRMESFVQDADGVHAVLRDQARDETYRVRADYLVGADGHKGGIREALGVAAHGRVAPTPTNGLFLQFETDLDLAGGPFALVYLQNPELPGGNAAFTFTDHPGRYVLGVALERIGPQPEEYDERMCVELIQRALGTPAPVKLVDRAFTSGSHHVRLADRYVHGRVALVGDAAHLMPPYGGQGGSAAVLDGYHLAWRLAAVIAGWAGHGLLASHDAERRPYGEALAEQQYANMVRRAMPEAMDDTVAPPLDPMRAMFGYARPSGAFVPDQDGTDSAGTEAADTGAADTDRDVAAVRGTPCGVELFEDPATPSGRPGTRAPHVPVSKDGAAISTRDLYGRTFVLLAGPEAAAWAEAATNAATRLGVPLNAYRIGEDLTGADERLPAAHRIGRAGAVLIRPDGVIAWRSPGPADPAALDAALRTILCR